MFKRLKVSDGSRMLDAIIRNYGEADFKELIAVQARSFPPPFPSDLWWNEDQLISHVKRFPEGAICVEIEGQIAGSMTALRRQFREGEAENWATATDNGYIRNHEPDGDTLYVVDICIDPVYRRYGLGKWLMQSMYETVVQLGCRRLLGGGRMPGYRQAAEAIPGMTPQRYVDEVASGIRHDPVLTFLIRCGRMPVGVAEKYLADEESGDFAALMEWRNPFLS